MSLLRGGVILLFLVLPAPAFADNCGSLSDCYGNILAAVAVAVAIVGLVAFLMPEVVGAAAIAEAGGTEITGEGLAALTEHLAQFGEYAPNAMMIERLQGALEAGGLLAGADANFYLHELYESEMMAQGMDSLAAHDAALEFYSHSPFSLYAQEVIQAFPEHFNSNWLRYWGLLP